MANCLKMAMVNGIDALLEAGWSQRRYGWEVNGSWGPRNPETGEWRRPTQRIHYFTPGFFPNYFDEDQLYSMKDDPYEQVNLAYRPEYRSEVNRLQALLSRELARLGQSFGEF